HARRAGPGRQPGRRARAVRPVGHRRGGRDPARGARRAGARRGGPRATTAGTADTRGEGPRGAAMITAAYLAGVLLASQAVMWALLRARWTWRATRTAILTWQAVGLAWALSAEIGRASCRERVESAAVPGCSI